MTLGKIEIKRRLNPTKTMMSQERIVITPLLHREDQIGGIEINVRLGRQFLIFKEHFHGILTPELLSQQEQRIWEYQEEIVIAMDGGIVLHPGRFLIGSTLEYIALPPDIEAQVEGRSSWARIGLMIATATTIHPRFKGTITLELSNNGTIPIKLTPGMEIAQIIFRRVSPPVPEGKDSRYFCQIGPVFSRISKDKFLNLSSKAGAGSEGQED